MKVRKIKVSQGDVFEDPREGDGLVVESLHANGTAATVRNSTNGRRHTIAVRTLQRSRKRLGEIDAAACHRALARLDKQRRAVPVRS